MQWFRFPANFVDDPIVGLMPETYQLVLVKLMCLAINDEDHLIGLTDEEIAWRLRITGEVWESALSILTKKGILSKEVGGYKILDWRK